MLLSFAGHTFEPLLSGALYWRAESMLLVADLHFEKFSSYARRGQMLPPYDTGLTLKRLDGISPRPAPNASSPSAIASTATTASTPCSMPTACG